MSNLRYEWETNHGAFEILTKEAFDKLFRDGQFSEAPLISEPSKWSLEFGPYDPHRWAFGELNDGRLVCCDTTAKAAGGE